MYKFFAHIVSESCDRYYIQFEADRKPESDAEWIAIFRKHVPNEIGWAEDNGWEGPGIGGSWLFVNHVGLIV
jgi:hypothetical protein